MKNDTFDKGIILYPEFEKLKEDVEKLRTELSMLLLERDELLYVECKNIEMAYMLSIGGLEYKAYEIECAILRLKRKAELIQAKKNRQEKINTAKIEELLDIEFSEYQAKLDEQIHKMNAALARSHGQVLTEEEIYELKKSYRAIVKSLHPDLHPDLSDEKLRLFFSAVEAYENGDVNGLHVIETMVCEPILYGMGESCKMVKEKERLCNLLQNLKKSILQIKSEYPYTMKAFVQNPPKIIDRKSELTKSIQYLNEVMAAYTAKIARMLR